MRACVRASLCVHVCIAACSRVCGCLCAPGELYACVELGKCMLQGADCVCKLRVCAGQVPWGRRVVYVCTCVTETVHMKFGEGHAYVSGYLGGNGRAGATILGGRTVGSGWLW